MAKIKVEYLGNLRTNAIHLPSGNELITDAPIDNKGKGEYFSPTDLVGASLLTCMITVMGILANEKGIPFQILHSEVDKIMTGSPRRIAELIVQMKVKDEGQTEKQRAMLIRAAEECPVAYSIHPDINQELKIVFE